MKKYLALLFALFASPLLAQIPAFPGAQGSGAGSVGGRGGAVILVTNTNDSGPGSLRACVEASGPRNCIFRTGGNIKLQSRLTISNPFITISGQTAPGGGIWTINPQCTDCGWWISTHDVIMRYIGCSAENASILTGPNTGTLCILATNADVYNAIFDHISMRWWGNKGYLLQSNGGGFIHETTVQRSLIYEPNIGHPVCAMFEDTDTQALGDVNNDGWGNLLVNCDHRMPLFDMRSGRWVNNIVYNYGDSNYAFLSQGGAIVDIIGNKYVAGNLGGTAFKPFMMNITQSSDSTGGMPGPPSHYMSGNIGPSQTNPALSQLNLTATGTEGGQTGTPVPSSWLRSSPLASPQFPIQAQAATSLISGDVGASSNLDCHGAFFLNRNSQDARIITEYNTLGTGQYFNNQFSSPALAAGSPCTMTLNDGIPNQWKTDQGLSTTDTTLYQKTAPNGYTYLENYMNGISNVTPPPPSGRPNPPTSVVATPH